MMKVRKKIEKVLPSKDPWRSQGTFSSNAIVREYSPCHVRRSACHRRGRHLLPHRIITDVLILSDHEHTRHAHTRVRETRVERRRKKSTLLQLVANLGARDFRSLWHLQLTWNDSLRTVRDVYRQFSFSLSRRVRKNYRGYPHHRRRENSTILRRTNVFRRLEFSGVSRRSRILLDRTRPSNSRG